MSVTDMMVHLTSKVQLQIMNPTTETAEEPLSFLPQNSLSGRTCKEESAQDRGFCKFNPFIVG